MMEMSSRHGHHRRSSHNLKSRSHYTRGNPEGDSISVKKKFKVPAAPRNSDEDLAYDSGVSSMKRRRHNRHDEYGSSRRGYTNRRTYSDSDISSLDVTDTPESLSQISAIAPDISLAQTTFSRMRNNPPNVDATWENAVSQARGEPDGAEKSFHKKASRSSVKVLATVPENESFKNKSTGSVSKDQENIPQNTNPPISVERKKSIKGQLRKAASVLKKARSKSKLPDGKVAMKRKMDATLADETMTKKPSMKELSKKDRKQVRKTLKSNFDHIQRSKKIWEELRRQKTTTERKTDLCRELMNMVRGKMKEFCYAHDTARVIQSLIMYGSQEQKEHVFEELKDEINTMVKSKYAKFLVKKMLMYGTKHHRNHIYLSFHGQVRKLIRHKVASDVIEFAYNEYASANQRLALLEDFYGPSFTLFRTPDIKCLGQIMLSQPDKRDMILRNMKEALLPLIDKDILAHTLVHKVFVEFFTYADTKMRSEMIEAIRESVIHMLHTRDGARVAMHCVWHGTAKDRKMILKSFKGNVVKICKEEYGHLVLLAIFDCVDDTKIVSVILLEEIMKSLTEVVGDQYGRKTLLYLLSPRDPHHFHPDIVRVLQDGDQNLTSKKDKAVRYRELLEVASPRLLQYVVENATELVVDNNKLLLLLGIITHALGESESAMQAVANIVAEPFTAGNKEKEHIVENAGGHMTLKNLNLNDKTRMKTGSQRESESAMQAVANIVAEPFTAGNKEKEHIVENAGGHMTLKNLILNDKTRMKTGCQPLFAEVLLKTLPEGAFKSWAASNRGCFTLVFLLELDHPEISKKILSELKIIKQHLNKVTFKGAQILLKKMAAAT